MFILKDFDTISYFKDLITNKSQSYVNYNLI